MSVRKLFFACSLCAVFAAPITASETQQQAVDQAADIDQQIHDLQVRRERCQLRQRMASDSADRRQNLGDYIGYRQDMQTVTFCQQKIQELDERIAALQKKKAEK